MKNIISNKMYAHLYRSVYALLFALGFLLLAGKSSAQTNYEEARRTGNVTVTEVTRAQLMAMPNGQLRETMINLDFFNITDLVNATPAQTASRQSDKVYMSVEQFNQADYERKMHVIMNPSHYVIVQSSSQIPKTEMSRAVLNSLPEAKKQAIIDSGDFKIID